MAKEIFLLGFDEILSEQERRSSLSRYAWHLQRLGVGRREVEPMIMRPELDPYIDEADLLSEKLKVKPEPVDEDDKVVLKDNSIHPADYLAPHWQIPFANDAQANACIIGVTAHALHQSGVVLKPVDDAQIIILAQPGLANDFLRLNPNGVSKAYFNIDRHAPVFSRYFIEYVHLKSGRELDRGGLTKQ